MSIQANELRIGNLLAFDDGSTDIVKFEYPFQDEDEIWFIKWVKLSGDGSFDKGNSLLEDFNPIPITPEILKKCGFEKVEHTSFYRLDFDNKETTYPSFFLKSFYYKYIQVCRNYTTASDAPCEHLHQLQNLYFALTGTELTIKL